MENKVDAFMNAVEIFSKEIKIWLKFVKLCCNAFDTMKIVKSYG